MYFYEEYLHFLLNVCYTLQYGTEGFPKVLCDFP